MTDTEFDGAFTAELTLKPSQKIKL